MHDNGPMTRRRICAFLVERRGPRACFLLLLGAATLCATAMAAQRGESDSDGRAAMQPASSDSADAIACMACHKDVVKGFANNPHSRPSLVPSDKGATCESCHGPGKAHAEGGDVALIFNPARAAAKEVNQQCQSCHARRHANFELSVHSKGNMSCIGCHSIHSVGAPKHLLKVAEPQLCFQCHGDVKPQFSMPFHHKVEEGLINCTDCHDPHGAFEENSLPSSKWQFMVCTKCHAATAGPFVYEHAAVKAGGCTACHVPHSGPNPKMLTDLNVNTICLRCHFPTPNSIANRPAVPEHILSPKQPSCIGCHSKIHGCNSSDVFLSSEQERGKR